MTFTIPLADLARLATDRNDRSRRHNREHGVVRCGDRARNTWGSFGRARHLVPHRMVCTHHNERLMGDAGSPPASLHSRTRFHKRQPPKGSGHARRPFSGTSLGALTTPRRWQEMPLLIIASFFFRAPIAILRACWGDFRTSQSRSGIGSKSDTRERTRAAHSLSEWFTQKGSTGDGECSVSCADEVLDDS